MFAFVAPSLNMVCENLFHTPCLTKVQQMFSLVGRHVTHVTNTFLIAR